MEPIKNFFETYNHTAAIWTFGILAIATIITMVRSEWKRGDGWWRP